MKCEKYYKKGKRHIKLTEYKIDMNPKNVVYHFDDVLPENARISSAITNTVNENPLEIFGDVKPSFEKVWAELHLAMANQVFAKIPVDEIFLE